MSAEVYGNTGPDSRREPHAVTENATRRGAAGGQEPAPTGHAPGSRRKQPSRERRVLRETGLWGFIRGSTHGSTAPTGAGPRERKCRKSENLASDPRLPAHSYRENAHDSCGLRRSPHLGAEDDVTIILKPEHGAG